MVIIFWEMIIIIVTAVETSNLTQYTKHSEHFVGTDTKLHFILGSGEYAGWTINLKGTEWLNYHDEYNVHYTIVLVTFVRTHYLAQLL
jgi:hypothetical protein